MPYFWPLLTTPAPSTVTPATPFTALSGASRKAEEIKKLVPPWMETRYPSTIGAFLHAMGTEDNRLTIGDRTLFIRGANPAGNVIYVAKSDDAAIEVRHVLPTVNPSALIITVTGKRIAVQLRTDAQGGILTTASELRIALAADPVANLLVGLTTFGSENEAVGSTRESLSLELDGLEGARRDVLLGYARGSDLAIIGNNYGVTKPTLLALTDGQFRQYIASIAFQKKCNRATIEAILTVIFGDKATAGWAVYESLRRRTITIEVTSSLLATGPGAGTFLRRPSTVSTVAHTGDYLRASAVAPAVGKVKPTSTSAVSSIPNNSVYVRGRKAFRPVLFDVLKLVRAAGVQVEFIQRKD